MAASDINPTHQLVIEHTKAWLEHLVIGLNFCPFAKKEFIQNTIGYRVFDCDDLHQALMSLSDACMELEQHRNVETSLLIFHAGFAEFDRFVELIELANGLLESLGFDGTFQLAHFHPCYQFAGAEPECPSNFTNRAPYPTLHLLREQTVEHALTNYPNPERIPDNNITRCKQLGYQQLSRLFEQIRSASAD